MYARHTHVCAHDLNNCVWFGPVLLLGGCHYRCLQSQKHVLTSELECCRVCWCVLVLVFTCENCFSGCCVTNKDLESVWLYFSFEIILCLASTLLHQRHWTTVGLKLRLALFSPSQVSTSFQLSWAELLAGRPPEFFCFPGWWAQLFRRKCILCLPFNHL